MGALPAVLDEVPADSTTPDRLQTILEINRSAYDHLAPTYRASALERQVNAKEWLIRRIPPATGTRPRTALDIGCADGTHARVLSTLGFTVTGVDFSPAMIAAARELNADPTLVAPPRMLHGEFLSGDYTDERGTPVRLDDELFDVVLATAFVHLFPPESDEEAMSRVLAHVAPGGTALVTTTVAADGRRGLEDKAAADGVTALRWRNHYALEMFLGIVRLSVLDAWGTRASVRPWILPDRVDPAKRWVDVVIQRPD